MRLPSGDQAGPDIGVRGGSNTGEVGVDHVHHIDLGVVVALRDEGDAGAIGRPSVREVHRRVVGQASDAGVGDVEVVLIQAWTRYLERYVTRVLRRHLHSPCGARGERLVEREVKLLSARQLERTVTGFVDTDGAVPQLVPKLLLKPPRELTRSARLTVPSALKSNRGL